MGRGSCQERRRSQRGQRRERPAYHLDPAWLNGTEWVRLLPYSGQPALVIACHPEDWRDTGPLTGIEASAVATKGGAVLALVVSLYDRQREWLMSLEVFIDAGGSLDNTLLEQLAELEAVKLVFIDAENGSALGGRLVRLSDGLRGAARAAAQEGRAAELPA